MIRDITRDTIFLQQKSAPAAKEDLRLVQDLLDTLQAHEDHCVGLAANMIGTAKAVIAVKAGPQSIVMLNPVITKKSAKTYTAREGCLSLPGERSTVRHESIEVKYRDARFKKQQQKFSGFTAQIIQHEIDHCNGILI